MEIEKTATIQAYGCLASELDDIQQALTTFGSERPIIDDGFVMTDLEVIRGIVRDNGERTGKALPVFKEVLEMGDFTAEISRDEKVMFTL